LYGLSVIGLIWSVSAGANQPLQSPGAVLDALNQRTGNVILAMVDDPRGRTQWTTQLTHRFKGLEVSLNAASLGRIRTNTLRYVQPRLGVNRLAVGAADAVTRFQFPAFRSAGVPTGIVVLGAGASNTMRVTPLTQDAVARIRDALNRSLAGGMSRVIALIQNRGIERIEPSRPKSGQWSARSDDDSPGRDSGDDSDGRDRSASDSNASASNDANTETSAAESSGSSESNDAASGSASDESDVSADDSRDFDVSADRRSFY
jgi:hypothetical protein